MATHTPTPQFKFNGSGADTHISLPARTGISKSQDHTCSQLLLYVHSHTPRCFIAGVVFGKTEWGRCALAIPSMYGQHSPISSLPVHLRVRPPRRPVAIFRFFRRVSFRTVSGIFCRSPHALPKRCGIANSGFFFPPSTYVVSRTNIATTSFCSTSTRPWASSCCTPCPCWLGTITRSVRTRAFSTSMQRTASSWLYAPLRPFLAR